jgi:hypothetical protein
MLTLILAAALTLPPQKTDAVIGVMAIHLTFSVREDDLAAAARAAFDAVLNAP